MPKYLAHPTGFEPAPPGSQNLGSYTLYRHAPSASKICSAVMPQSYKSNFLNALKLAKARIFPIKLQMHQI